MIKLDMKMRLFSIRLPDHLIQNYIEMGKVFKRPYQQIMREVLERTFNSSTENQFSTIVKLDEIGGKDNK